MANEKDNKQKEVTTAPGADSTSETQSTENQVEEKDVLQLVLESNAAVIESNNAVLAAIEAFNENAETVVRDIIREAKSVGQGKAEKPEQTAPIVKINKKARYVVAPKGKIMSEATGAVLTDGADVSDFDAERLVNLIAQGVVVEASDK